jgi:uncharacterized protein YndB with AHSA1/START domain
MDDEGTPLRNAAAQPDRADTRPIHGSFTLTRQIAAPPETVFRAYADLSLRQRWFRIPGPRGSEHHELDFRVGGGEVMSGTIAAAGVPERIAYRSHFFDIVAARRLIFACELAVDGRRRSVALVTIELTPAGAGTQLTHTEQYTFVTVAGDGQDDIAEREGGTRLQLNALASAVERGAAAADERGQPGI